MQDYSSPLRSPSCPDLWPAYGLIILFTDCSLLVPPLALPFLEQILIKASLWKGVVDAIEGRRSLWVGCFILCCFKAILFFSFLRSYLQPFVSRAQFGVLPKERWFGDG